MTRKPQTSRTSGRCYVKPWRKSTRALTSESKRLTRCLYTDTLPHKEEDEDVQRCKTMNKGVLNCSISDTMDTIKRVITTNEKFKPVVEYMKSIGCDTTYEDNRILSLFDLI